MPSSSSLCLCVSVVILLLCLASLAGNSHAQSRRARTSAASQPAASRDPGPKAEALYAEALDYADQQIEEMKRTEKPLSRTRLKEILLDQRRVAVRNATRLSGRTELKGED